MTNPSNMQPEELEVLLTNLLGLTELARRKHPHEQFHELPGIIRPWEIPRLVVPNADFLLRFQGMTVGPDGALSAPCFSMLRRQIPRSLTESLQTAAPPKSPAAERTPPGQRRPGR